MRLIRRFPVLEGVLLEGLLNTTQLGVLAPVFTAENVDELVRKATHLTKAKTKELAVTLKPKDIPADGLRKLPTPVPRPTCPPEPARTDAPGGPSPVMVLRIPEIEEARREREARRAEKAAARPLTLCEPVARWRA